MPIALASSGERRASWAARERITARASHLESTDAGQDTYAWDLHR